MRVKVFLSATFSDVRDERLEVIETFRRFRTIAKLDVDLVTMEDFGFSSDTAIERSLALLEKTDAYLGVLGFKYGSIPPGGSLSYTEREYRHAHQKGLPIFILEKTGMVDANNIERDAKKLGKLNALKEHANKNHSVLKYENIDELGKEIAAHLPSRLQEKFGDISFDDDAQQSLVPHYQLQTRATQFTQEVDDPKTLDVLSISSIGFLRDRATLEKYLRAGCRIRLISVKREGFAEKLMFDKGNKPDLADDLKGAMQRVARFQAQCVQSGWPGRIELREFDWIPSVTIFAFDAALETCRGWIGIYTPDITSPGGSKWVVELTRNRGSDALSFYCDQFERLWAKADKPIAEH